MKVRESAPARCAARARAAAFERLEIIAPLEARIGVPVISSMPHGLWAGAKLVGLPGAAPGYGTLLSAGQEASIAGG